MINGINKIWMTLDMKSQNTKAIGGSKFNVAGATQPNRCPPENYQKESH
jgi:hypothetical protein